LPPLILNDEHDKNILNVSDFVDSIPDLNLIDTFIVPNIGVAQDAVNVLVEIYKSSTYSKGVAVFTRHDTKLCIGNVEFEDARPALTMLLHPTAKCIQIRSVIFLEDYRGRGLGTAAYERLAQLFYLISDTRQTLGGAQFWKRTIANNPRLEITIVKDYDTIPYFIKTADDTVETYSVQRAALDPLIWSAQDLETQQNADSVLGISCGIGEHCESVVLVAKKLAQN
jgi:hypothetical protein